MNTNLDLILSDRLVLIWVPLPVVYDMRLFDIKEICVEDWVDYEWAVIELRG